MKHTKSFHKGHPNPQGYRPTFLLLNGKWNFLFDDGNEGLIKKYFANFPQQSLVINVPYAYESPHSGIEDKSEHNILWYQKLWIIKLFHITKIIFGISRLIFQILPSQLYLILKKEFLKIIY